MQENNQGGEPSNGELDAGKQKGTEAIGQ